MSSGEIVSVVVLGLLGLGIMAGQGFQITKWVVLFWGLALIVLAYAGWQAWQDWRHPDEVATTQPVTDIERVPVPSPPNTADAPPNAPNKRGDAPTTPIPKSEPKRFVLTWGDMKYADERPVPNLSIRNATKALIDSPKIFFVDLKLWVQDDYVAVRWPPNSCLVADWDHFPIEAYEQFSAILNFSNMNDVCFNEQTFRDGDWRATFNIEAVGVSELHKLYFRIADGKWTLLKRSPH